MSAERKLARQKEHKERVERRVKRESEALEQKKQKQKAFRSSELHKPQSISKPRLITIVKEQAELIETLQLQLNTAIEENLRLIATVNNLRTANSVVVKPEWATAGFQPASNPTP